jgi:hypothetical protein
MHSIYDGIVEVGAATLERLELSTAYAPLNFPSFSCWARGDMGPGGLAQSKL